jgi:hypothetical protein
MTLRIKPAHGVSTISTLLFVAGAVLAAVASSLFIILAAAAVFLPDLLRVVGVLRDVDELHETASAVAARIALSVGLLYSAALFALTDLGLVPTDQQRDAWLTAFILAVTVRYIAYLIVYWDVWSAAPRVFLVFGSFWLCFVVLSSWGEWITLVIETAVVVGPFVLCSLLVRRYPRTIGAVAVVAAVAAFLFFGLHRVFFGDLGALIVFVLIVLPLSAVGIGLLIRHAEENDEENT